MKKYKVELVEFMDDNGEGTFTNPEIMDLVNVDDRSDVIPCAPDEFKPGEVFNEDEFILQECNYVDDLGVGLINFAFRLNSKQLL